MGTLTIPSYVVEYFLLGQTRKGEVERYTQDGGIVIDVWLQFAQDIERPLRVLVGPTEGVRTVDLGYALHKGITTYRASVKAPDDTFITFAPHREPPNISPLENFVAATIYFDELLRVVLPLTRWWDEKNLRALHRSAVNPTYNLPTMLRRAITIRLGREDENSLAQLRKQLSDSEGEAIPISPDDYPNPRIIEASPIAALIGVFCAAIENPNFISNVPQPAGFGSISGSSRARAPAAAFLDWVNSKAEDIADAATEELRRYLGPQAFQAAFEVAGFPAQPPPESPPALIERMFLNREAQLADAEAICTIKADAATRLFEVACRDITWAIIDAGIDSTHPAFLDHGARNRRGEPLPVKPCRVRATFDFTLIQQIRNYDLTLHRSGSAERGADIASVVEKLVTLPGRKPSEQFRTMALRQLSMMRFVKDLFGS
jgi:serine protease AprX